VRMLDEKQIAGLAQNVKQYVANARVFAKGLKKIG
jgi:hypothetical protein